MPVYPKKQVQVGVLLFDNTLIEISTEYSNYSNIFLVENAVKLQENIKMNEKSQDKEDKL